MPRYIAGILPESDLNKVADLMRDAGANIINVRSTTSKRISGRIFLECTEELAGRLEQIEGVKYFEQEIPFIIDPFF